MFNFFKKSTSQEPPDLWKHFRGMDNSDAVLEKKATLLGIMMVDWSREAVKQLIEKFLKNSHVKKDFKDKTGDLIIEAILLYVHFADRIAFAVLEPKKRDIFIDKLMDTVIAVLLDSERDENKKSVFKMVITDTYNKRQTEYSKYKIEVPEGQGLGGTLFWEFTKKVAEILGCKDDVLVMTYAQVGIVGRIKFFQIPQLLKP